MNIFKDIFAIFYNPVRAIESLKEKSVTTSFLTFISVMFYYFLGNTIIFLLNTCKINFNPMKVTLNFILFFTTVIIYSFLFLSIYFIFLYLINGKTIRRESKKQFLSIFLFLSIIGLPFAKIGMTEYMIGGIIYDKVSVNPFLIGIFSPLIRLLQPKIISIMGGLHLSGEIGFFLIYMFNFLLFMYLIALHVISQKKIFGTSYLKGFSILFLTILTCFVISYFDQLYFKLPSPFNSLYSLTFPAR